MPSWVEILVTIICSVFMSSGFWAYLQQRNEKHDSKRQLILGLGHDKIVSLGMSYISRGDITQDEYENLTNFIYAPYIMVCPNDASVKKIMQEVNRLPIKGSK